MTSNNWSQMLQYWLITDSLPTWPCLQLKHQYAAKYAFLQSHKEIPFQVSSPIALPCLQPNHSTPEAFLFSTAASYSSACLWVCAWAQVMSAESLMLQSPNKQPLPIFIWLIFDLYFYKPLIYYFCVDSC